MGYKAFCDRCEKETPRSFASQRLLVRMGEWKIEVMVAYNGVWNSGVICEACLMQIIREGQEVPTRSDEMERTK